MNTILNSREEIAKLDKSNVLGSVEELPKQLSHSFEDASSISLSDEYRQVENCVFVGMGGSALGARLIDAVYADSLPIPFEVLNNYELPHYVGEKTLVILSSYSGTTEEVLNAGNSAVEKNAKIVSISAGGKLEELANKFLWPHYHINATFNPSNQPRMAIGYAIIGQLVILSKLNLLKLDKAEVEKISSDLNNYAQSLKPESVEDNVAKSIAIKIKNKLIFLVSSDHLTGAVHVFNNQLNENAKHLTQELVVPEMNHHYLESLRHPVNANQSIVFIFFQSDLYHHRNQKRIDITEQVAKKNGYQTLKITAQGSSLLSQSFQIIQLGGFINFYLSMLHGIDPAPIPWVDFFKQELGKD